MKCKEKYFVYLTSPTQLPKPQSKYKVFQFVKIV